jgi:hypothetical protein
MNVKTQNDERMTTEVFSGDSGRSIYKHVAMPAEVLPGFLHWFVQHVPIWVQV